MTKMYKAVDRMDGVMSLFLVKGDQMAICTYYKDHVWFTENRTFIEDWIPEPLVENRMINPQLIWEI